MSSISKTLQLLNRQEKSRALIILLMVMFGAFLETIGVGLILPYISIIQNQDLIKQNNVIEKIYDFLLMNSEKEFLIWIGIGLIVFYLIKNIMLIFFLDK